MEIFMRPMQVNFNPHGLKAKILLECGHSIDYDFIDYDFGFEDVYKIKKSYICYACVKELREARKIQ